jgi:hypothetical protein
MNLPWYIVMIFSSSGLFALEVYTRAYNDNPYILTAMVAIFINPILATFKSLAWFLTPEEPPKPSRQSVERVITEEEKQALKLSQLQATKALKMRQQTA